MKNRKLILIVSLVLAMTMSLGGTLAYLSDTDADVNTMVLGNVTITQNEHQRAKNADGTYKTETIDGVKSYVLEVYENDKPLLPTTEINADGTPNNYGAGPEDPTTVRMTQVGSYGGMFVFTSKLAQDKFVTVTNTGKTDAYVRTYVAFEIGSTDGSLIRHSYHKNWDRTDFDETKAEDTPLYVTINNNNYMVYEYVYLGASDGSRHVKGVLPAGDTTYPSLSQVYLKAVANNDDMVKLDGNKNDKLDILVLSQAIQADGFVDAATALKAGFGEANVANVQAWFEGWEDWSAETGEIGTPGDKWPNNNPPYGDNENVTYEIPENAYRVTTAEELEMAVANGENTIVLAAGEYNANLNVTAGKTLNLYGESKDAVLCSTMEGGEGADYDFDGSTVNFYGLTIDTSKHSGSFRGFARMNANYYDCVIIGEYCLYGNSEFEYCTLNTSGDIYNIRTWGAPTATFDNCTFNSDGKAMLLYGTANTKLTLNKCVFNDTGVLPDLKAAVEIGNDYNKSYELIVNKTIVNGYEINDKGINTGSTLWGNKNSMGTDKLNVVIDGVDVY